MRKLIFIIFILLFSLAILSPHQLAAAELSTGGTIFVPAYRSFYQIYGSTRDSYPLTSTVFFHNIDPKQSIEVLSIGFYDSSGKLLKNLLDTPLLIKPQNSKEITLQLRAQPDEDCGAHLIVRWKSAQPANTPVVEVLMVGQVLNRGVSFLTQGYEVKE
jgi:hypothetical protein